MVPGAGSLLSSAVPAPPRVENLPPPQELLTNIQGKKKTKKAKRSKQTKKANKKQRIVSKRK